MITLIRVLLVTVSLGLTAACTDPYFIQQPFTLTHQHEVVVVTSSSNVELISLNENKTDVEHDYVRKTKDFLIFPPGKNKLRAIVRMRDGYYSSNLWFTGQADEAFAVKYKIAPRTNRADIWIENAQGLRVGGIL